MTTQTNGNSIVVQGRMIWTLGQSIFEGKQKTDMTTKQVLTGADGKPIVEYGFGLAVPKVDPRTGQNTQDYVNIYNALHNEAKTLFPSGQIPPTFAMKFKDGDTAVDDKGIPYSKREGYAGHFVLSCTTRIPLKFFRFEGGNNILVADGFKCGDYVNVQLNIKAHPAVGQSKAGLYVNPSAVQFIAAGKEIINSPSGDQLFGQAAPQYAGQMDAYTAPTMPGMGMPGQAPMNAPMGQPMNQGMPQQGMMNPGQMQQPALQGTPSQQMQQPAPHYDVLPQHMQPQTTQAPMQQNFGQPAPQQGMPMNQGMPAQGYQQQSMGQPMNQGMPQQAPMNNGYPQQNFQQPYNNGMPQ